MSAGGGADVFVASMETSHFDFMAVGESGAEALLALQAGLDRHGMEYGLPADWYVLTDANVWRVPMNRCARDGRVMNGGE